MSTKRVLCTREVQESIRDSVHRLLSDQIEAMGLGAHYQITRDEIRGSNGSLFVFSGLHTQTVESIKSFEGVDIVWCEEAHGISKKSWDTLLPTIRKPGSEVWMTLNPSLETDETYQRFIAVPEPDSWVKPVNWRDNPWFPEVLENERLSTLRRDPDSYENIWEGVPVRVAEGAIYRSEVDLLYAEGRVRNVPYDPILPVHTIWDLGWNDSMTIIMAQRAGSELRVIDYIEDSHKSLPEYVQMLETRPYRWGKDFIPHDGAAKDFKTGKSTEEILQTMGRSPIVQPAMSIEEGIRAARLLFPRAYFDAVKCERLLECLKRYRRKVSKDGTPTSPLHDEYSHGADAWRYVSQAIDQMDNNAMPKVQLRRPREFHANGNGWMA